MSLQKIKGYISKDSKDIPRFIDTKIAEHHHSFTLMQVHIFPALLACISNKFLPYISIENINYDILMAIHEIKNSTDDDLYNKVWRYIMGLIKEYEKYAIELELYESVQNLNQVYDLLDKIKNNKTSAKR